ncbi:unnamed protein product [Oppiella nova]|uniref:Uncharacterized protein n=1 Tax=Oppiella nova TaxID=334625 RepID=A0A7R9MJF6_9ACAR|nr:unnamed protein product [Oppiella nova]CAG2177345.1 unnamed protein product [Oppiella nova]
MNVAMSKWETDSVDALVQYKAGTGAHVNVSIGLDIGLRGIPEKQLGETINYNEHYSWEWSQGRVGFGPQAGIFHQQYRYSQYKGLPNAILWVAELSVPLFVLSLILFQMVIQYGALFLLMTGSCLISANILYSMLRNPIPLRIPFEHYISGQTVFLAPHYSLCYYLNLINGIFCLFLGVIAFFSDLRFPDETAEFFGIDVLQSYEDYFADVKDVPNIRVKPNHTKDKDLIEQNVSRVYAGLRKRNLSNRFSRLQKSWVRKKPITNPRNIATNTNATDAHKSEPIEETPLYENFQHFEPIIETEENQSYRIQNILEIVVNVLSGVREMS